METIKPKAAITFILSIATGMLTYLIIKSVLALFVTVLVIAILDKQSIMNDQSSKN